MLSFSLSPSSSDADGLTGVMGSAASTQGPAEFQNDDAITAKDISDFAAANGIPVWNISQQ